jgi:hypothetical protein
MLKLVTMPDHHLLNRTKGGRKESLTIDDSIRIHAVDYWGTWLFDDTAENENSSTRARTLLESSFNSSGKKSWGQGGIDQFNGGGFSQNSTTDCWAAFFDDTEFAEATIQQPQTRQNCRRRNKTSDPIVIAAPSCHSLELLLTAHLSGSLTGEKSHGENSSVGATVGDLPLGPPPRDQLHSPKRQQKKRREQITDEKLVRRDAKPFKRSGILSTKKLAPRTLLSSDLLPKARLSPPIRSPDQCRRLSKRTSVDSFEEQVGDRPYLKSLQRAQVFDAIEEEISAGRESSQSSPRLAVVDFLEMGEIKQNSQPHWCQLSAADAASQCPRLHHILERQELESRPKRPSISSYATTDDCSTVADDDFHRTLVQLRIPVSKEKSLRVLQIQIP